MDKTKIAIYGAGGFGREVAWLAQSVVFEGENIEVACFIDDNAMRFKEPLNGYEVLSLSQVQIQYPGILVVSGIGVPHIRELTMNKAMELGFGTISLIHPTIQMSQWIRIGEGVVICAGSILTTNIILGKQVQINLNCTVGHDVVISDYATLSPGVHISGCVDIGKRVYIGTGAVVINGTQEVPIIIGEDAVVGAGACVTCSIPPGETWAGVPARPIKKQLTSKE